MAKVVAGVSVVVAVAALVVAVLALTSSGSEEPAPTKADRPAYTVAFVEEALRRYEEDGLEASIAYHNSPESVDGQWYVFVIDEAGAMIAHPTRPDRIGTTQTDRVDVNGYYYGADFAAATEDGRWVSYWFTPPGSDENAQKHAWVVRHDGLLFGSGWYERDY